MGQLLMSNWLAVVFGLISAGALAFCRYCYKQIKKYKQLLGEEDQEKIEQLIDQKINPIAEEIKRLSESIIEIERSHQEHLGLIVDSYKFRLVQLCKLYLKQGYMTTDQYQQLSEFYNLYHSLGGNGQAEEYYEKAIELPIKD